MHGYAIYTWIIIPHKILVLVQQLHLQVLFEVPSEVPLNINDLLTHLNIENLQIISHNLDIDGSLHFHELWLRL